MHKLGISKWSAIAVHLPGRSDNEIKNHWHTCLKKRSIQELTPNKEKLLETSQVGSSNESCSTEVSSCATSVQNVDAKCEVFQEELFEESTGNFWTEPFLLDSFSTTSGSEFFVPSEFDHELIVSPFSPVMFYDEFLCSYY
ncbi:hypothetical protein HAX54_052950 [Datura stramonium]|uniref:Uncharacterized protein n=1 Tax=Datura stramonium TaxID=4076 RepID=A0ABS8SZM9_DATST|nr:hypothetical protein [Datura stramonium]